MQNQPHFISHSFLEQSLACLKYSASIFLELL